MLITLLVFVPLFALTRLFSSVWLQYWIDQGDGRFQERQLKATADLQKQMNATIDMTMTTKQMNMTDDELKGFINDNPDLWFYQLVYGLTLPVMLAFGIVKGFSLAIQLLRGAFKLHNKMLKGVLYSPMQFFESNPVGRILNRFTQDQSQ